MRKRMRFSIWKTESKEFIPGFHQLFSINRLVSQRSLKKKVWIEWSLLNETKFIYFDCRTEILTYSKILIKILIKNTYKKKEVTSTGVLAHLTVTTPLWDRSYYCHVTEKQTEAQNV